ncbi:Aste57867_9417 [Aphanomyces stellatus]|uniref:Aste57867_9417 protein n=1 Tax=Aphanomyces stellatus TaxID=120398 RepID=A0A485KMQ6_9STRA|nr:hypothetical protein As57867_009381 [Aphanomyces stellatus]VFT86297.1 Aste57867_9417 [Aphanomyces stellatus]
MVGPDENEPNVKKQIQKKRYQLEKASRAAGKPTSCAGLPPGQTKAPSWLVLDIRPSHFDFTFDETWRLDIFDNGKLSSSITLADLHAREADAVWVPMDFHCVTSWTYLGLDVRGIPLRSILPPSILLDNSSWKTMMQFGGDKYSTSLPRDAVFGYDGYLVYQIRDPATGDTVPLGLDHGSVRVLFPKLYGFKSAKWLTRLEFHDDEVHGFWEALGYHAVAEASLEQRFAANTGGTVTKSIMNPLNGWFSWYAIHFPENFLAAQQCLSLDVRQIVLNWRFYWLMLTFWVCLPSYMFYYGGLTLTRLVLRGQAAKYHAN